MKAIDEIKNTINNFKVKSISIFVSYLRGEQEETIDLFGFIQLENYLAEVLGCKVDLVMKDALKPRIKDRLLREAVSI